MSDNDAVTSHTVQKLGKELLKSLHMGCGVVSKPEL